MGGGHCPSLVAAAHPMDPFAAARRQYQRAIVVCGPWPSTGRSARQPVERFSPLATRRAASTARRGPRASGVIRAGGAAAVGVACTPHPHRAGSIAARFGGVAGEHLPPVLGSDPPPLYSGAVSALASSLSGFFLQGGLGSG